MFSLLFNRIAPRTILPTGNASVLRRVIAVPRVGFQPVSRSFLTSVQLAAEPAKKKAAKASGTEKGTNKSTSLGKATGRSSPKTAPKKRGVTPKKKVEVKLTATERNKKLKFAPEELPPKRPMGAFLYFATKFGSAEGKGALVDHARKAGEVWRQMSAADKQPYLDEASRAYEQYTKERDEYFIKASDSLIRKINLKRKAQGRPSVRRPSSTVQDKAPWSPYIRFYQDIRGKIIANASESNPTMTWVAKEAGRRWKALSDEEKAPYIEAWTKEMAEYTAKNPKVQS